MNKNIKQDILDILKKSQDIPEAGKTVLIDQISEIFDQYKEPVSKQLWVPINTILPNGYNPNKMATPEKHLLLRSMLEHGITLPLIVSAKQQHYMLIDGYHRWNLIKKSKVLQNRLDHRVPVVLLDLPETEEIVASIRHNRARGKHQIEEISEVVKTLSANNGWSPSKIMEALGMDADEVLRLKQFKGLGELFKDDNYSQSWH